MYTYYVGSNWAFYENKMALFEKYFIKTNLQILLSYAIIYILIPHLLNKSRKIIFILSGLISIYIIYVLYTAYRFYIFDPKYPDIYRKFDLYERITDFNLYFNEITWFIFPTIILVALQYYNDQKEVLSLREQKKTTELNLLKNQLNPHFLFNTLNNLYTLALKKSDKTPEVIGKLSAILDYMLYHCNDKFVALSDEISLINNYIELEKIRYGRRLEITFDYKISKETKIAPLILLSFVENAFKHGVKEEINLAEIKINLYTNENEILFRLENSIPFHKQKNEFKNSNSIGLRNIKKQLNILYPNSHALEISERSNNYLVTLKMIPNDP
ncbi:sensor histidine kinase [Xanthovirga aplysinae]|uniref:sensor histidine kinase n=1 Tax=Xanthovirga aplysinae TaxID=2529853 RepID=UPI0016572791|nr:sensor histidine kinase [Xanthovirga aplysinae]